MEQEMDDNEEKLKKEAVFALWHQKWSVEDMAHAISRTQSWVRDILEESGIKNAE